ncbi:MAG: hypothetical protein ACE5JL_17455, partial [Dehalococcoidia bacterium]
IIFGLPEGQRVQQTSLNWPAATMTGRELIAHKVDQEVAEYVAHQRPGLSGEYLSPEVLTRTEVPEALVPGTVDDERVHALRAFIAGGYMIVINDQRIVDPETLITLRPETRVEFIKILPLVGG